MQTLLQGETRKKFEIFFQVESEDFEKKIQILREESQTQFLKNEMLKKKISKKECETEVLVSEGKFSEENEDLMKNYSLFIYLLRNQPTYIYTLTKTLTRDSFKKFLHPVLLQLFGYGITSQEKKLISTLILQSFEHDLKEKLSLNEMNSTLQLLLDFSRFEGKKFFVPFLEKFYDPIFKMELNSPLLQYKNLFLENELQDSFEIDSVKILRKIIFMEEVKQGKKFEKNSEDDFRKVVESIVQQRIEKIKKHFESMLKELMSQLIEFPTGFRSILKGINTLLLKHVSNITENERISFIGDVLFHKIFHTELMSKYLNNSEVIGDSMLVFMKITSKLIKNNQFDPLTHPQFSLFNEWIQKTFISFKTFVKSLIEVKDIDVIELPQHSSILMTVNQVFSLHSLCLEHLSSFPKDDPLVKLLSNEEMKKVHKPLKTDQIIHIPILNRFEGRTESSFMFHEIYNQSKKNIKIIINTLPLNSIQYSVRNMIESSRDQTMKMVKKNLSNQNSKAILFAISQFENDIPHLIKCNKITEKENYNEILEDVLMIAQNQKKEFQVLQDFLGLNVKENEKMEEIISSFSGDEIEIVQKGTKLEKKQFKHDRLSKKRIFIEFPETDTSKIIYSIKGILINQDVEFSVDAKSDGVLVKSFQFRLSELIKKLEIFESIFEIKEIGVVLDVHLLLNVIDKIYPSIKK
jgi:hypothetical protein